MSTATADATPVYDPAVVRQLAAVHPLAWAMHSAGWRRDRRTGVVTPRYLPARHLKFLAKHLMRIHRGECKRLLVSMPPRHGKTLLTSRYFLGWWLGTHPADRVITTTYQARLVQRWSRNIRNDLARHGPAVFGVAASTRAAADDWDLLPMRERTDEEEPVEGGVSAVGTGGALTGKGAHLLNCDDLVKGSEDVRNVTVRDHMWEWFEQDLMTRLEPDGAAIVTMTRWHPDDIPGRIIKSQEAGNPIGGESWEIINLAALAGEDDPLGRAPGESLWEERWPRAKLERMKRGMSPYAWSALFDGRPVPAEGGIFKKHWFSYFEETGGHFVGHETRVHAQSLVRFVTFDPAFSKKTSADHSAIGGWALDMRNNRLYLLKVVRDRFTPKELAGALRAMMSDIGATLCYGERNNLKENSMKIVREAVPLREIQPNTDKVARAMPATAHFSDGRLLFRRNAPWLPLLEEELLAFSPDVSVDDQVDMVSYGVYVANEELLVREPPPSPRPAPSDPKRRLFQDPDWRLT